MTKTSPRLTLTVSVIAVVYAAMFSYLLWGVRKDQQQAESDRQAGRVQQILIESCEHAGGEPKLVAEQYLWCERDGRPFTLHHEEVAIRLLQEGLVEP